MNRNSKLRDRIRDATNEAILAAAEAVFADEGLHNAKVETIAAKAGVSVGTIYNHLGDRDSVLTTLLTARKVEMIEQMGRALDEGEREPFTEQLDSFLRVIVGHFEAHRKFFLILMEGEAGYRKTEQMHETMCQVLDLVGILIERGVRAGAIDPVGADLLPGFLLGMVRAAFLKERIRNREPEPLLPRVPQLAKFFMRGAGASHG